MSKSLLLLTSNGVGMGHLARQSAVALAAPADTRVTIMSMSAALPSIGQLGLLGEYCPGPDRRWQPDVRWPHYVSARIQAIANEVDADVVSFDGVAPYRGVTLAKREMPDTPFVWFRRGMWQPGANEGQLWKADLFDFVLEPGDLSAAADRGATAGQDDVVRVPPVSLYQTIERLNRQDARSALNLTLETTTVLVTLGTGRLGDVASPGQTIVDAILERTNWQVAVLKSAIAENIIPLKPDARVREVSGVFPLVKYLDAFDAVVSAAGYNAVHEFLPAGLPTMLVPNTQTRTDDQVARAREAEHQGYATVAGDALALSVEQFEGFVSRFNAGEHPPAPQVDGATATVEALVWLAESYKPNKRTLVQTFARARDDAKAAIKRVLGPQGTNAVKRALGRPTEPPGKPMRVTLGESSELPVLRYSDEPTIEEILGNDPVEHVLSGSSSGYRSQRELIADEFYDIVP